MASNDALLPLVTNRGGLLSGYPFPRKNPDPVDKNSRDTPKIKNPENGVFYSGFFFWVFFRDFQFQIPLSGILNSTLFRDFCEVFIFRSRLFLDFQVPILIPGIWDSEKIPSRSQRCLKTLITRLEILIRKILAGRLLFFVILK